MKERIQSGGGYVPPVRATTSFNADQWSRNNLGILRFIILLNRCLSAFSGFAAVFMLVIFLAGETEFLIFFVFLATFSIAILIMGEALQALCLIAENSKSVSIFIIEASYNFENLQRNIELLEHNIKLLEGNVDEMCTSLSEIADSSRESSVHQATHQ